MIEMAEKKIRAEGILPDFIRLTWLKYDDKCDAAIATISMIDAFLTNCSHLLVGPSCEYSVCEFIKLQCSELGKNFSNQSVTFKLVSVALQSTFITKV